MDYVDLLTEQLSHSALEKKSHCEAFVSEIWWPSPIFIKLLCRYFKRKVGSSLKTVQHNWRSYLDKCLKNNNNSNNINLQIHFHNWISVGALLFVLNFLRKCRIAVSFRYLSMYQMQHLFLLLKNWK